MPNAVISQPIQEMGVHLSIRYLLPRESIYKAETSVPSALTHAKGMLSKIAASSSVRPGIFTPAVSKISGP